MQIFDSLQDFSSVYDNCVATIGKYDGMHLGHQYILENVLQKAREMNLPSVVILSEPQPEEFFAGNDKAPARLTHFQDKVSFLESFGIDVIYRLNFDQALSEMSADDFIKHHLVEGLGVKALVVGHDFAFGHKRSGNVATLIEAGKVFDFKVSEIDPQIAGSNRISSTLVRELLKQGDCAGVTNLLGRPYSISGKVIQGKQLGRKLSFATANIALQGDKSAVAGVFVVSASLMTNDKKIPGVANVGVRPTVDSSKQVFLEVHLLDFSGDIYDQTLTVNFLHKIRDEMKFENVDVLKTQISKDVEVALTWLEKNDV